MKIKNSLLVLVIILINSALITSCKETKKSEQDPAQDTVVVEETIVTQDPVIALDEVWVIEEHQINNIPVTSKAVDKTKVANNELKEEAAAEAYEIATIEELHADLVELDYEAHQIVAVEEQIIPVDETQTVVSYNGKGKELASFQVISSGPNNEVEQIIFSNKKHKDIYEVSPGMSAKEVKKLRKKMKHFVKHGQVFLYEDNSNIMYLMEAEDMVGDQVAVEEVDNMDVKAVVWKDKKHRKHKKNS